jgi:hypothetical protein
LQDVAPGTHHVSVEAANYEAASLIADVKSGGTVDFGTMHLLPSVMSPSAAAPSATPSVAVDSSTPPPPASTPAPRDLQSEISQFVTRHLEKSVNANISGLVEDYAERVNYYENGVVDHSFIVKDRQTYAAAWPYLKLTPYGDVRLRDSDTTGQVAVSFDYRFEARNSKGIRSMGDAANLWIIDTSGEGLKITSENQTITNRRRSR